MAVSYQNLLHNVALRMSALTGTQFGTAESTYSIVSLGVGQFKSTDWPFSSFRDAILMAEEQFADVAASSVDASGIGNHTWRASMGALTAPILNNGLIPSVDAAGTNRIIGAYGEAIDSLDSTLLIKRPVEEIRRIVQAAGWRDLTLYYYNIVGRRLITTRTSALLGVCIYNRATQITAYDSGSSMLLPDTAEPGISSLAVSLMTKDGAFREQAANYHTYATEALAMVAAGGVPNATAAPK